MQILNKILQWHKKLLNPFGAPPGAISLDPAGTFYPLLSLKLPDQLCSDVRNFETSQSWNDGMAVDRNFDHLHTVITSLKLTCTSLVASVATVVDADQLERRDYEYRFLFAFEFTT